MIPLGFQQTLTSRPTSFVGQSLAATTSFASAPRTVTTSLSMIAPTPSIGSGLVNVAATLAPLASIVVCAAPLPTLQQISKNKSVGSLPLLPYSSMVASCFLWTMYGLLQHEPSIWASNAVGAALAIYYVARFLQYSPSKSPTLPGSVAQHLQGTLAIVGTAILVSLGVKQPARIVGKMGIVLTILLFGAPLAALRTVLQQQSAESIPLPFTLASVTNCFLWTVLGVLKMKDSTIIIPNALGLSCGMLQLLLKIVYGDGRRQKSPIYQAV